MNMKRLLTLVAFFATLHASAQQVNPVPDYVFANRMSAGRNTVTDTAAYFSIGPRYGATRGMMPPMVVDTASFSANKRNGLLIFSVQKNKFLYWDSVGVKWAEMAGTGGTAISSGDTAAMLLPYVRHAGYGLTKSGQAFLVDTLNISTRAWRQKGLDSLAALEVSGSGTTNYISKFTASSTIGNSQIFDNGTNVGIATTSPLSKFHVVQSGSGVSEGLTVSMTGASRASMFLNSSSDTWNITRGGSAGAGLTINSSEEILIKTITDVGDFALQINGNNYVSGNLFVGTTSSTSSAKLDVVNSTSNSIIANFDSPNTDSSRGLNLRSTDTSVNARAVYRASLAKTDATSYIAGSVIFGKENRWTTTTSTFNSYLSLWTVEVGTYAERLRVTSSGAVGIGTSTPSASAQLDVTSTTRGFLPPRMTTAERDAISSPAAGLIIYNTSTSKLQVYTTSWTDLH